VKTSSLLKAMILLLVIAGCSAVAFPALVHAWRGSEILPGGIGQSDLRGFYGGYGPAGFAPGCMPPPYPVPVAFGPADCGAYAPVKTRKGRAVRWKGPKSAQ
jgi:hypothetical protein